MKDEPTTEYGKRVKATLSPEKWIRRAEKARERAGIVQAVLADAGKAGKPSRASVRKHAAGMHWSTFRHCLRCHRGREGPAWERQLDLRLPEPSWSVPEDWKNTVAILGHQEPQPSFDKVRETLVAVHGEGAALCDNTLRELWQEVGVWKPKLRGGPIEKVTKLYGGGGLVLVLAAAIESGIVHKLAMGILRLAAAQESGGGIDRPEDQRRDENGCFTPEYNQARYARYVSSSVDPIYHSVDQVRGERDLSRLQVGSMRVETLENRLLGILSAPLVTEARSFSGLDGPLGMWLSVLSSYPYKSATVDKTLAETKLLNAGPTMWSIFAPTWFALSRRWGEKEWSLLVAYVDATHDPYWTERFAASGKVSRTGRNQPCLTRVCLSAGPGVPILTDVVSGTAPLRKHMESMLARADELLGPGELGRITVVDAECGTIGVLRTFHESKLRDVVSVIKGQLRRHRKLEDVGKWQGYREQDRLREARLQLADGLAVRVVEMERLGSRNPVSTWFATTAGPEKLTTEDVPDIYLSRWPHQEDLFRRGRDACGLERSHGYGVSTVENVAVLTRREQAGKAVQKGNEGLGAAIAAGIDAQLKVEEKQESLSQRQARGDKVDGRARAAVRRAEEADKAAQKRVKEVTRKRDKALAEQRKQETTPDEIYVRDTALDSITTCLKMTLLALLEFVCQEYLDKWRIMPRTLADRLVPLAVTIRERRHEVIYEVEANPRDPLMMALLADAFDVINQRQLRKGKRRIIARIRDGPD